MSWIKDKTIFGIWIIVQQVLNGYIAEYRRWLPWQQLIDLLKSNKVIQFNLIHSILLLYQQRTSKQRHCYDKG